jgi:hypothetical protein
LIQGAVRLNNPTPTDLDIERAQVHALLKRLNAGTPLTEAQQKQVSNFLAAEKLKAEHINNNNPAENKRGRKKKIIVPRGTSFATMRDAQLAVVNEAKDRIAKNKPLANHHARALRDAWLLEQSLHIWPTLAAASADLKVSPQTLRNMAEQGCPFEPHSPIAKAPVLAWLLERAHERGGNRGTTTVDLEDVSLQWQKAKLDKLNGRLIAEAEDRAQQGVIAVMTALRHHLQNTLPGMACDAVTQAHGNRNAAEEAIIKIIDRELVRLEPRRITKPNDNQSTEELCHTNSAPIPSTNPATQPQDFSSPTTATTN